MSAPLASSYAADGTPDTTVTLAHGAVTVATTLREDLAEDETEMMVVESADGAPIKGTAVIEDETIYYESRYGNTDVLDLQRGQAGTVAAPHTATTPVTIYGPPRFGNPAVADSIIAMQAVISDLQARVEALEGP